MENRLQGCTSLPFLRLFTSNAPGKPAHNGFGLLHFFIFLLNSFFLTLTYILTTIFTTSKNQTYEPAETDYT